MKTRINCHYLLVSALFVCLLGFYSAVAEGVVDWSAAKRVSDGVEMVRLSYDNPRLMKACALRVDLFNKTLAFTANGRDKRWGRPMPDYTNLTIRTRRVTVEEFMMNARAPVELGGRGLDMIVAFNTAPWTPCPEPIPTLYAQPPGYNVSDGVVISDDQDSRRVKGLFVIWKNGRADILPMPLPQHMRNEVWIAHAGFDIVLKDGQPKHKPDRVVHPRTVVGISRDGRWLYILAVEGRHEGVSLGADYWDLAQMMLSLGAYDALNLDGGGSTTLLCWDDVSQKQVAYLQQDTPPRRNALNIGIYRRNGTETAPKQSLDGDRLFEVALDADVERSAGIYYHYEFTDVQDTPPPPGYKPFYISHYGRHGSRYQISTSNLQACAVMQAAEKAGILTAPGKRLLRRLNTLAAEHQGMFECLSLRGADEHKRLAQRMHDRFPEVFSGKGKVCCQSTTRYRCLTSMANFASSLKGTAPQLDFDFMTGGRYMEWLQNPTFDRKVLTADIVKMEDRLLVEMVNPTRLLRLLFTDSPETDRVVGSSHRFVLSLFDAASACQSLERELDGLDIGDFFTRDERLALACVKNCKYYAGMGNSVEFGDDVICVAKPLARDVVTRADEAVKGGDVRADLRFGHDSMLLPFAGLMGLEGPGDRVPAAKSWRGCPLWKIIPMAANMQIVLYRKEGGVELVKVLYNEQESTVRGLKPYFGPYYRWEDFRAHLLRLSLDKTIPSAPATL